jgi:hypothetical protein
MKYQITPNPYPNMTPDPVWISHQLFLLETEPKRKSALMAQWKEIQSRFEVDAQLKYVKDEAGNFKQKDHRVITVDA